MKEDKRQIRTPKTNMLLAYRAEMNGERGLAIIRNGDPHHCLGFISKDELNLEINSGPVIRLSN